MEEALDRAYSQYKSSDIYIAVRKQFSAPSKQYMVAQYIDFIVEHCL
jgi:hypothetical protein